MSKVTRKDNGQLEKGSQLNPSGVSSHRKRLSEDLLSAFMRDFERYGFRAIARVRRKDPATYVKIAVSLLPKVVEHSGSIEHDVSHSGEVAVSATSEFIRDAIRSGQDTAPPKLSS